MKVYTYGEGGYDPSKPNNNVVETQDVPGDAGDTVTPDVQAVVDKNQAFIDAASVQPAELFDHVKALTEQVSALLTGDTPSLPSA